MEIEYPDNNQRLTQEEAQQFCYLLARLVRFTRGGFVGELVFDNANSGEEMLIHLDAHDAKMCDVAHKMRELEQLDRSVGEDK